MKKRKKIILGSITGALALALAGGGFWAYKTFVPQETPIDKNATVASNFYQAVNKDWLLKAKIPADSPSIDNFYTLDEDIKGKLKKDIKNLGEGKETSDITGMSEFITFYKAASNYKQREKDGLEPLKPYLKEIEDIKDVNDLASKSASLTDKGIPLPFGYDVGTNAENTSQKQIQLSPPSILLPDVSIYKDEASKKQYLTPIETATQKALEMLGYSEKNSKRIVKEALEFDEIIAKYSLSNEEISESKNLVHPKTAEEINDYSGSFKLYDVIKGIMGRDLNTINVPNTKYFENYSKIVNQDNFSKIKSWILVQEAMAASNSLTEDYRLNFASISMAIMGTQKPISKEDTVYEMSVNLFSDVMSVYYGRKYFGEEAKTDVTGMIDKIKNVYRGRLQQNDWLTEGTRNKAIEKLDKMKVFVGYQEDVDPGTKELHLDPNKSFFELSEDIAQFGKRYTIDHFDDPIDKNKWSGSAFDINAYYNPESNSINFPAGILQAPFYDKNQSTEKNYGGIGVVIGHEITHAFDSNGADYDENGDMHNWWTKADTKAFDKRIKAFEDQWNGLEIYGTKVNGKLTVTENVADAGGLSSTLQVLKTEMTKPNLKDYFENYADIWKQKASLQYNKYTMVQDVHAPNELRVNQQLKNLPEFYEAYPQIKEGDAMYLAPSKRISLW
ncbi:M13 family metallopeptidase [Streptococcus salivarius]|uniref:M13 family metallopeptidase n=2 Tax=Streptococcus TaxID=1301 RepID=UPI0007E3300B|nr:M13 family metallopeptidase [Streptococcus salivarius]MBS6273949.1 M13 family metallopeptidase [Streptococcus salivarius]MCY7056752.1 M13 family metallopeptidase [Streptococcus salivarius]MDU2745037.1 M13 family metallopeptidase [Streptococcus salivarius]MTQ91772.1 M13 family peptidase [Streptococcus salivarius]PKZ94592.1 M13 family peptidase [Streptococcus salivarius]